MYMASVKKFTESAVVNQLRHIERTIAHPENMDIEKDRTVQNYSLLPQREISSYEYYRPVSYTHLTLPTTSRV